MTDGYDYPEHSSVAHWGYLDGIQGRNPNPRCEGWSDYDEGWLRGAEDQHDAQKKAFLTPTTLKRGSKVLVPKGTPRHSTKDGLREAGRSYTVVLHNVYPAVGAYMCLRDGFVYPRPAKALWAGTGGYWCETDASFLIEVP